MKRLLIIDRDGTLIKEPPVDFQVDSLEKLEFMPGVMGAMHHIQKLGYVNIMATNQDGLGTESFPEETFWPTHQKMMKGLGNEGIFFQEVLIDRSFEEEHLPTRKPGIGMFSNYLTGEYNIEESVVIGDRITDVILAKNLGCKAILLQPSSQGKGLVSIHKLEDVILGICENWSEIARLLCAKDRSYEIVRDTRETQIHGYINLDQVEPSTIDTGLSFFNHMLDQIVHHAGITLQLKANGDLNVDEHHTMEDVGIVVGELIYHALGKKVGIERYGFALPMDESSALVLLDFSGRIDFVWDVSFKREMIGDVPTEMFEHFFKSVCHAAKCNLHISAKGSNDHHKIEGVYKAFARALKSAIKREPFSTNLPSSKGIL